VGDLSAADVAVDLKVADAPKIFQMHDTAVTGEGYSGGMGYWENEEVYPADFPATDWGEELAGMPVRHHRFPTLDTLMNGEINVGCYPWNKCSTCSHTGGYGKYGTGV
jgi:hypothetical protein